MNLKKYTVKQNAHDFKPNTLKQWLPKKARGFHLKTIFEHDCLEIDPPSQWNKVGGITSFINLRGLDQNNSNVYMGVYQSMKNEEALLFNAYVNYIDTSFKFDNSKAIIVQPKQAVFMDCMVHDYDERDKNILNVKQDTKYYADFFYWTDETKKQNIRIAIDDIPCRYREIGPYYGGRIKSSQKRTLWMGVDLIK